MKRSLVAAALFATSGEAAFFRGSDRHVVAHKDDGNKFGSDACPCIGFDDIEGDTVATIKGKEVKFPADLGGSCEAWDEEDNPECTGGKAPDWCRQKWCYVDARKCDITVMPKLSSYQPEAKYQGLPLHYSYSTCDAKDTWTKEVPEAGLAGCRCIGLDNSPGTTMAKIGDKEIEYPAEIGGECSAWDSGKHPECEGDKAPDWCSKKWCFVDSCSCTAEVPPKASDYLGGATFQGKQIYYSYATCGEKDSYSSKEKVKASKNNIEETCRSFKLKDNFGSDKCPCVGFDGVEGDTLVTVKDEKLKFPADLGGSCEAWDKGNHPECKGDKAPDWCKQDWCYVDPKNCNIDVMPKMTTYQPDARFQNLPVYYSYATCGGKDTFTKDVPAIGSSGCKCIGFDNSPGTTKVKIGDAEVAFPAEIGGECSAWDAGKHPECTGEKAPDWCAKKWCFVDPCSCSMEAPPKTSDYLGDATFQGKKIYYSYATCGEKDSYSSEEKVKASKAKIAETCGKEGEKELEVPAPEFKDIDYNNSGYEKDWHSEYKSGEYPKWTAPGF